MGPKVQNQSTCIELEVCVGGVIFTPVDVIFGCPTQSCVGNGICVIIDHRALPSGSCPRVRASAGVNACGSLQLLFEKGRLSAEIRQKYFSKRIFTVDEMYRVPPFLLAKFRLTLTQEHIPPGEYPITSTPSHYLVEFNSPMFAAHALFRMRK